MSVFGTETIDNRYLGHTLLSFFFFFFAMKMSDQLLAAI